MYELETFAAIWAEVVGDGMRYEKNLADRRVDPSTGRVITECGQTRVRYLKESAAFIGRLREAGLFAEGADSKAGRATP